MTYYLARLCTISVLVVSITSTVTTYAGKKKNVTEDDEHSIVHPPETMDNRDSITIFSDAENHRRSHAKGCNGKKIFYCGSLATLTGSVARVLTGLDAYSTTSALHAAAGGSVGATVSLTCTGLNYIYLARTKEKPSCTDTALCCGSGFIPSSVLSITTAGISPPSSLYTLILSGVVATVIPPIAKCCLLMCKKHLKISDSNGCGHCENSDETTLKNEEFRVIIEQPHSTNEHK